MHAAEHAAERVKALRRDFIEAIQHEDVTRFKFVDETSVNLTYTRRYGRAPGGQRVSAAVALHNGSNVTVVAALSAQGVEAVMELEGARDGRRVLLRDGRQDVQGKLIGGGQVCTLKAHLAFHQRSQEGHTTR